MTAEVKLSQKKGSGGLIYSVIFLLAMVVLYIGERMVFESQAGRAVLAGLALAGILTAIVGRLYRRRQIGQTAHPVESRILICYLVSAGALLLYAAQADFVMERLRPLFAEARSAERYQVALSVLWPIVWTCAILPLLFIEISYSSMHVTQTVELNRIRRSAVSGLILGLTLSLLFLVNYISSEFNKKVDLSYFKTTQPSESSKKMIRNLSEPLQVILFFPGANEVQEQAEAYFAELKKESSYFQLRTVDHALAPDLAKELSVTDNGTVVLSRGKQQEKITIGTKLKRAKSSLKKLDSEFQNAFAKLSRVQKVAYFTVGHEERALEEWEKMPGSSIRDLRALLLRLNYAIKDLGIGQGLGVEVPSDATLVIVPGPRKEFLPAEVNALKTYLQGGGRMMAFLDPEAGLDMASLLNPFGLKYSPVRLANDRFYVRLTYTPADRHFIFSNRFSSHPSVSTLTRHSSQLATVMLGVGALEEIPSTEGKKPQIQFTLHSMPFTWNDLNNNRTFDAPAETRKAYEMAATVTMKGDRPILPKPKAAPPTKGKSKGGEPAEMRLLVVADSDLISDQVFRNPGNGYLFLDSLKWLSGEEELIGETSSEEDVKIMHTRKEDQLWFYLTIFGAPALVLGAGLFYTTRRRRRS